MRSNTVLVVIVLVLAVLLTFSSMRAGEPTARTANNSEVGRYVLVNAVVDTEKKPELFRLDTVTGKTWVYVKTAIGGAWLEI